MGRVNAPTYELEHDLDHSVSYVQGMVRRLLAERDLDYERLASKEQREVAKMLADLESYSIDEDERDRLRSYLTDLNLILLELMKC
jgi:hypothetical protein